MIAQAEILFRMISFIMDKVRSDIVLSKAGLPSLNEAVSTNMAGLIWRSRKQLNPLGQIFTTSKSSLNTRAAKNEKLFSHIPAHSEAASNNLANIWNQLDLKSAKSVLAAKALAKKHYRST